MLKFVIPAILMLHGLIHLLGFLKAFQLGNIAQLTYDVPKPLGLLWLMTGLVFVLAFFLNIQESDIWAHVTIGAVVLSQILISTSWEDAKFGSLANMILLGASLTWFASTNFENVYLRDVSSVVMGVEYQNVQRVSESDLAHLPSLVQKYLHYVGVVGRPKVQNFRVKFEGNMRSRDKDWFAFTSEQHNFVQDPSRFFFMRAKLKGLPVAGYHRFEDGRASMQVKLFSLFQVVDQKGDEMNKAETVTFLNDICLLAPGALIHPSIKWAPIDSLKCKAIFRNKLVEINAILEFNEIGQLINFISEDRCDISDMRQYTFSTPIHGYQEIDGLNLCTGGDAIWHYPDGPFTYGKFHLQSVEYNISNSSEEY